jgi:hypothetical protein
MRIGLGILLVLTFALAPYAGANDAAITNVGGTIRLMDEHPHVRLVAEHVHARVFREHALVECVFILRNDGPASLVQLGFPDHSGGAVSLGYDREFEFFRSYVNGKSVDVKLSAPETRPAEFTYWWTKEVRFEEGEAKVVRDVYRGGIGGDTSLGRWFSYLLHTGASWAGPIGVISLVISLEDFGTDQLVQIAPPGYDIDEREVRWTFADYEPTRNWEEIKVGWNTNPLTALDSQLHREAALGHIDAVRMLLNGGADIDSPREGGVTPLMDALWFGAGPEAIRFLLENGADAHAHASQMRFPLQMALSAHSHFKYSFTSEVVKMLLEHGAEVNAGVLHVINEAPPDVRELLEERRKAVQTN